MLPASLKKNDKKARIIIFSVSFVVFTAVVTLSKLKIDFRRYINLQFETYNLQFSIFLSSL